MQIFLLARNTCCCLIGQIHKLKLLDRLWYKTYAASNPRSGAMQHMQPVASLRIPNEYYLLSDRKNSLEQLLGTSVSKHLDMTNAIIEAGEVKIISTATTVEERIKRESYR